MDIPLYHTKAVNCSRSLGLFIFVCVVFVRLITSYHGVQDELAQFWFIFRLCLRERSSELEKSSSSSRPVLFIS